MGRGPVPPPAAAARGRSATRSSPTSARRGGDHFGRRSLSTMRARTPSGNSPSSNRRTAKAELDVERGLERGEAAGVADGGEGELERLGRFLRQRGGGLGGPLAGHGRQRLLHGLDGGERRTPCRCRRGGRRAAPAPASCGSSAMTLGGRPAAWHRSVARPAPRVWPRARARRRSGRGWRRPRPSPRR